MNTNNKPVSQEVKGDVTLSNTYPRKEYKSTDLEKSLASLGLKGSVSLVGKSGAGPAKAAEVCTFKII